jgi:hypothetical protein
MPALPLVLLALGAMKPLAVSHPPLRFDAPVLALAALDDGRLAALTPESVLLYRLGSAPALEARVALPGPLETLRAPAGVLSGTGREGLWVLTNRTGHADLLEIDGHRLSWSAAAAVPPGFPPGLAYRRGTNLLEAPGVGPLLSFLPGAASVGVDAQGFLLRYVHEQSEILGLSVGPPLAWLPPYVVASSALPPAREDRILLIDPESATIVEETGALGAVRALAVRGETIFAAIEESPSAFSLLEIRATER